MPRIRLSTRQVDRAPNVDFSRSGMERARAIGDLGRQVSGTIDNSLRIINQIKENDARIAATEWETAMMRGLNGYVTTGPDGSEQRVPGFGQKTFTDYDRDGGSPQTDLAEIEKTFQASDTYQRMDGITRKKFDRMVMIRREQYRQKANELYDRNKAAKDKFWDARAIELADEHLKQSTSLDDAEFEKMNDEVAKRKLDVIYKRMNKNDERVAAAWKEDYKRLTSAARVQRVTDLADQGAKGDTRLVDGQPVPAQADLDRAAQFLEGMKAKGDYDEKTIKDLGYKIVQAQAQLDNRIRGEIEQVKDAALVHAYDENGLAGLGKAETALTAAAAGLRKGSAVQTAALEAAKKLGLAADQRTEYDLMNDLSEGKKVFMDDGKTPIFTPGSRQAKLFPKVYEAYTKKAFNANHGYYQLEAETKMLEFAGAGNPQGYFSWLAQAVVDKKLTPGDFQRYKEKYTKGCLEGFKGQEGQETRQQQNFRKMNEALKDTFGVDFMESVKRTPSGDVAFDKFGNPKYDEKASAPDFKFRRDTGEYAYNDIFGRSYSTIKKTETISADKMKEVINVALELAKYDGAELPPAQMPYDLIWLQPGVDITKPHKVDAVADFKAFLKGLNDEKRCLDAASALAERAKFVTNIRQYGAVNERDRTDRINASKPITDKQEISTESRK